MLSDRMCQLSPLHLHPLLITRLMLFSFWAASSKVGNTSPTVYTCSTEGMGLKPRSTIEFPISPTIAIVFLSST
jgi:hypothetical protein